MAVFDWHPEPLKDEKSCSPKRYSEAFCIDAISKF